MSNEQIEVQLSKLLEEALTADDVRGISEKTQQEYEKFNQELGRLNILIIGKSGVGKSTLLNAVFKVNFANTGTGQAITQDTTQYSNQNCPLTIYDTKGIELPTETDDPTLQTLINDITTLIQTNQANPQRRIHMIWYCINARSSRFEVFEQHWIRQLAQNNVPIVLVLTQYFGTEADRRLLEYAKTLDLPIETALGVMAQDYDLGDQIPKFPAQGLEVLVERTAYYLGGDDRIRQLFVQQQLASMDLKEKEALSCVTRYTALTIPAATIPAPGIDSMALWTVLSAMIGEISSIFGLSPKQDFINTAVNVLTSAGSSAVATVLLPSLLKAFPGLGTLSATGVALVAFPTVAGAVGVAYVEGLKAYLRRAIAEAPISEADELKLRARFARVFRKSYTDYLNRS